MNSIAGMDRKTPAAEAKALDLAIRNSGTTNAAIARHLGISDAMVSQWRTGHRPMAAPYAPKLARFLDLADPGTISAAYANVHAAEQGNLAPMRAQEGDPAGASARALHRMENALDDLRYALSAITAAMVSHRPAEARDVARTLRKHAPRKSVQDGFLADLLRALDKAS